MNPRLEQSWRRYATSCLWFSLLSMLLLYAILRLQNHLPLNPVELGPVDQYVSFNTASSFTTNTNWQAYGGETTMTFLSQMLALTFQNFVSAAVGMAVLVALFRGFARAKRDEVGNFWRDLVRGVLYILLPLSAIVAILLVTQGVVQTLGANESVTGIQGFAQKIARGPAAGQIAIKQLGTNGGGFFNVNSAHPFEGGIGAFGNFIEMFSILLIPAALTYTFGKWVGNVRQGWMLFAVMLVLMVGGLALTVPQEHSASAAMAEQPACPPPRRTWRARSSGSAPTSPRCGRSPRPTRRTAASTRCTTRTGRSAGSRRCSTSAIGEVIWGGVGSGLYGMIFYAIIAVFIGGLMIGRTPEYLGKKIGAREVKLSAIAVLVPFLLVLALAGVAAV